MGKRNLSQLLLVLLLLGCGGGNSGGGHASSANTQVVSVKGSIKSVTGGQSEMNQWILALVERDSGIAHSAVVNSVGSFTIESVDLSLAYTLVLLDPQYRLSAVLTYAGLNAGKVRQYFALSEDRLPALVHNGPIINFTDFSSIVWEKTEAADGNGNLIPDGMETAASLLQSVDTDSDGQANDLDGDIDNDGLPNVLDSDDDGDAVLDAFDPDANGDGVADLSQNIGDQYFSRIVKYLAVQLVQDVQGDGSLASTLMLTSQLDEDEKATAVLVKGSTSLFTDAMAVRYEVGSGNATLSNWDRSLLDDGGNEDGEANDGVFARRVQLASSAVPKAKQVFFVAVSQGADEARVTHEFPFIFPDVTTGVISGSYTAATRKVTLSGSPFGAQTNYHWSVHVYDASGIKVFSSEPIAGSVTAYTLPTGVTEAGGTYTARIVATALDRIPSFPSWVIRSASFKLQ